MSLKRLVAPALVSTLLGASLAVTAAPAAAEPSWTAPDRVSRGEVITNVMSNGAGHIVVAGGFLTRGPSGSWSRPAEQSPLGGGDDSVVDRRGNVTVLSAVEWECDENTERWWYNDVRMAVAYRPLGGSWQQQTLPGAWNGCSFGRPRLAVDEAGGTTAVWRGDGQVWVTQRPPGGRWTQPTALGEVRDYDVVTDGSGRAIVAWVAPDMSIRSAVRSSEGTWKEPRVLVAAVDDGTVVRSAPRLEGGGDEPVLATWTEDLGQDATLLRAALRSNRGQWQNAQTVASTARGRIRSFDTAISGGAPTVVWYQGGYTGPGVVRVASKTDGRWTDPVRLEAVPRVTVPSVAANELGVAVAWTSGFDTSAWTMAAHRPRGSTRWLRQKIGPAQEVETSFGRERWSQFDASPHAVAYRANQFTVIHTRPGTMFSDFVDDTSPPRARIVRPRRHFLGGPWMPVRWAAADDLTGARNYDVRVRSAGRDGTLSRWSRWQTRTRAVRANHRVEPQRTYCFSARARDRAGNRGRWSAPRCVATPIDDRAFRASTGWTRVEGANAYRQTLTRTRQHGARLTVRGVGARSLSLIARTCPSCGVVRVSHAGRDLGRVDLSGPRTVMPRVIRLGGHGGRLTGRVVVRVVSRGKPVHVDGVIAQR